MNSPRRPAALVAAVAVAAVALGGCAGGGKISQRFGALGGGGAAAPQVERLDRDDGAVELVLDAIDVWDSAGAGEPELIQVGEDSLYFRLRPKGTFERAWMRLGLFWHSRQEKPILTVVVIGAPVEIKKLSIVAGDSRASLAKAKGFKYEPGKRTFDKHVSAAAFAVGDGVLRAMTRAENAQVVVSTSRGRLKANLSAVPATGETALRASAKRMFAEFLRRRGEIAAGQ